MAPTGQSAEEAPLSIVTGGSMVDWLLRIRKLGSHAAETLGPGKVQLVQTHISLVLVGSSHVLKIKKPVNLGFVDYSTLEKRREACENEIRLNRRLCDDVYLEVLPIRKIDGELTLAERGEAVEYAVLMRRLPDDAMLHNRVKCGAVTESDIERIAERLAEFHESASRGEEISVFGAPQAVADTWRENFEQVEPFIGRTISAERFRLIRNWVTEWLEEHGDLLEERAAGGFIREGHGDVRCESICLEDGVSIFDCIEFSERLRCCDVASEVAFLSMDLHARGRPDLGYHFSEQYQYGTGDRQLSQLLPFYKCYRAFVRGKVQSFVMDEAEIDEQQKTQAREEASKYFDIAQRYATPLRNRTIVAVSGLSGSGKSTLARALACELGYSVISTDTIRHELFANAEDAARANRYSSEANTEVYDSMMARARELLARSADCQGVILDATFLRTADRDRIRTLASDTGARWRYIECRLEPRVALSRIEERIRRGEGYSEATRDVYLRQRERYEPPAEIPAERFMSVDMSAPFLTVAHSVSDWCRSIDDTD